VAYHLKCISLKGHEEKTVREAIHAKFEAIEKQILLLQTENTQLKSEIAQLQPLLDAVMKVEQAIQQLQEGFGEMALMVQTLPATSAGGVWGDGSNGTDTAGHQLYGHLHLESS